MKKNIRINGFSFNLDTFGTLLEMEGVDYSTIEDCRCDELVKLIIEIVEDDSNDRVSLICNRCQHTDKDGSCVDFDKYCHPCQFQLKVNK